MPSNHLILCRLLLLLPSIFPSIRVFSKSALLIWWPKIWIFSFSISPSSEYSELISFRIHWFDLAVRRTLKNILQHQFESINSLAFSFLYSQTLTSVHDYWKNHSFDYTGPLSAKWCLLFNTLSRFVIASLPRSKHLSFSWLQSPFTVILEPKKMKSDTISIVSPSIYHEMIGVDAMIFIFWMLHFKPAFLLSSFTFIKRLFISSSFSTIWVVLFAYLRLLISL